MPKERVALDFHVMSQCPFGVQVENGIAPVLKKLGNAVDFKLHFIGKETAPGKFTSMHGENEVKGNMVQLCAKQHSPEKYMDIIGCMNKNMRAIPANFESCAKELKIDAAKINACVDGEEGKKLLSASFKVSNEKKAFGSPTIFLAGKKYSGGRRADDFMRAICNEFKKEKPAECNNIPEPKVVNLTILTDKRCEQCNPDRTVSSLKRFFPGLKEKVVDYSTEEGKKLYKTLSEKNHKLLPVFLFANNVAEDEGYARVKRYLVDFDKDSKVLRLGAKFDPTAEICDNKIDDDNNGKIDCKDEGCKDKLVCRTEKKNTLDVFVMSQCPYGVKALNSMKEVLDNFGNDIDFNVHFIANETAPGKFSALHGQPEVDENIRELCAIKHYNKNYKYMDYILCRNKNIRSNEWKSCAVNGIKASVIEKCSTGAEGKKLLSEDIKIANGLGIGASPTWLANNKFKFSGIAAEAIKQNVCKHNPGKKGCDKKLKSNVSAPKGGCGS